MKCQLFTSILIILICSSTFSIAGVIHVPQDQPTIQAGINASANGDTVLVAENTYYENINFNAKWITVASHYIMDKDTTHINKTIIDGSRPSHPDSGSVVSFTSGFEDTNSVLTGFTITGGTGTLVVDPPNKEKHGGGIFIKYSGAKIENNKIMNNHITASGDTSAGTSAIHAINDLGNLVLRGNKICNNSVTVSGNTWAYATVGIQTKTTALFENNHIYNNSVNAPGTSAFTAGLLIDGWDNRIGNYIIRNNIVSNNTAGEGAGGGVVIQNCSPLFYNNVISGNIAKSRGSGVWVVLYNVADDIVVPKPFILNNTIINNSTDGAGGGVLVGGSESIAYLMNNIVWGNSSSANTQIETYNGADANVRYSIVQGGYPGEGNFDKAPLLKAESLTNASPAIGAGIPEYDFGEGVVLQAPSFDINGRERPSPAGSMPDIGAWESILSAPAADHVIRVPQDQPTIQAGINASVDGDTVLVAANTYYENINFKGKAITVASHFIMDGDTSHINNTIIDGSQAENPDSASTVYFVSAEDTNSVLTGFTITGGKGTYTTYDIYNDIDGGGIYIWDSGAKIEYNKIINNHLETADDRYCGGAGIFGLSRIRNLVIRGNEISNNSATTTGNAQSFAAGAIVSTEATCIVENNRIQHNELSTPSSTFAFAAGLMVDGWDRQTGNYIVRNNIIRNNKLDPENSGGGGGMVIQNCSPLAYNNIISGNKAHDGGGIWVIHYKFTDDMVAPKPRLINNTIINNNAIEYAGGIMMGSSPESFIYLMNNIVAYNTGTPPYDQVVRQNGAGRMVRHCIVQGVDYGASNIAADPMLVADSLSNESPAIGAGTIEYDFGDDVLLKCPAFDINGRERPFPTGSMPDIGAWESNLEFATGIDAETGAEIPEHFALQQNYPNPFNPTTIIAYDLPRPGNVKLTVHNALGQQVAELVHKNQQAGSHSVTFDAEHLPTGIYVYHLQINGEYSIKKKMMLLK